ncbi:MAG: cytochrome P450 [Hyphomonadaceae bacterium]
MIERQAARPETDEAEPKLPAGLELSDLDPEFRENPHPRLDLLREAAPRYREPTAPEGRIYLTKHCDVRAALNDRALSKDPRKAPADSYIRSVAPKAVIDGTLPVTMIWMDDPEHRLYRGLVAQAFTPRAIEGRRAAIEGIVDGVLDGIGAREHFDALEDFGAIIPVRVISEVLGLPQEDRERFDAWARDLGFLSFLPKRTPEEDARLAQAGVALSFYLRDIIAKKREAPCDDLISGMIKAELDGRRLSDDEIVPNCMLMLVAGILTATDVIGNGVALLLQNREQWEKLKADPSLIKKAVDEILRYDPPLSTARRHVNEDAVVMGCPLKAGGYFSASLVAANHDPETFPDPHRFDIARDAAAHTSFGGGAHYCIGAALAKLELEIAFAKLAARFPNLRLAGESLRRKEIHGFRGYERVILCT